MADDGVPVHELQMLAGHASITTTQRYMNARVNSLAESMRQARERRANRVAHGDQEHVQVGMMGIAVSDDQALPIVSHLSADTHPVDQNPQNMVRPGRFELPAPRLGGGCSIP